MRDSDISYAQELLDVSRAVCPDPDCVTCKIRDAKKAQQLNEQKHDVQLEVSVIDAEQYHPEFRLLSS